MKKTIITIIVFCSVLLSACATETTQEITKPEGICKDDTNNLAQCPAVHNFIAESLRNKEITYSKTELEKFFSSVTFDKHIAKTTKNPSEKVLTWPEYEARIVTEKRIKDGVNFYTKNKKLLEKIQSDMDPAIVVATLGLESDYGKVQGDAAFKALANQAFYIQITRQQEFQKYLTSLLELGSLMRKTDHDWNLMDLKGSYMGALGGPQMMPQNAIQFISQPGVGVKNFYDNDDGMIEAVVFMYTNFQPKDSPCRWKPGKDIASNKKPGENTELIKLKQPKEEWFAGPNFKPIWCYNKSNSYAMAIYKLSKAIKAGLPAPPTPSVTHQKLKNKSAGLLKQKAIAHHELTHKTS